MNSCHTSFFAFSRIRYLPTVFILFSFPHIGALFTNMKRIALLLVLAEEVVRAKFTHSIRSFHIRSRFFQSKPSGRLCQCSKYCHCTPCSHHLKNSQSSFISFFFTGYAMKMTRSLRSQMTNCRGHMLVVQKTYKCHSFKFSPLFFFQILL